MDGYDLDKRYFRAIMGSKTGVYYRKNVICKLPTVSKKVFSYYKAHENSNTVKDGKDSDSYEKGKVV